MQHVFFLFLSCVFIGCQNKSSVKEQEEVLPIQYITVLGVAQDAGYPQLGCEKKCCLAFYDGKEEKKHITSLGFVDQIANEKYLFEATPDIAHQLHELNTNHLSKENQIDGVFLTHAHIGHYTGLMHFGREAMGAKNVPVYTMPKMRAFLMNNGPWSQLVGLKNIELRTLAADSTISVNSNLKIKPILVPHRDEFSETVGYSISGENKTALFIPDINKWNLWEKDIVEEVKKVDVAFLDATFFQDGEIPRPMSEVPHPFISETVNLFSNEPKEVKNKVVFIHFNHSNPAILKQHKLKDSIQQLGFKFAKEGDIYPM